MSDIHGFNAPAGVGAARAFPGPRPTPAEPPAEPNAAAASLNPIGAGTGASAPSDEPSAAGREAPLDRQRLIDTLDRLNQGLRGYATDLEFAVDDQYEAIVVRVVDRATQEIVQQIPPEKALALAEFFQELEADARRRQGPLAADDPDVRRLNIEGWLLRATV